MSLRDQFEAWYAKERCFESEVPEVFNRCSHNVEVYDYWSVQSCWIGYQAGYKLAVAEIDARENAIAAQYFENALSPTRKTPRTPINEIDY